MQVKYPPTINKPSSQRESSKRKSMAPTIRHIKSYYDVQTYAVDFFGEELIVTVTPSPSEIKRWIRNVVSYHNHHSSHPLVVGVGVQWTVPYITSSDSDSSQVSYDSDSPLQSNISDTQADILQLCVGKRCLIIQLAGCDRVPNKLDSFVEDKDITFVGIWNSQDATRLECGKHQLRIDLLDVRKFLGRRLRGRSFEEIVEHCMGYEGVRLDPDISRSNWCACYLDHYQVLQASIDAYVCFKLGVECRLWENK